MVKALKRARKMVRKPTSQELKLPSQNTERRERQLVKMETPQLEMVKRLKVRARPRKPRNAQRTPSIKIQWNMLKKENSRINGRNTDLVDGEELERHSSQWKPSFLQCQPNTRSSQLQMRKNSSLPEMILRRRSRISEQR